MECSELPEHFDIRYCVTPRLVLDEKIDENCIKFNNCQNVSVILGALTQPGRGVCSKFGVVWGPLSPHTFSDSCSAPTGPCSFHIEDSTSVLHKNDSLVTPLEVLQFVAVWIFDAI